MAIRINTTVEASQSARKKRLGVTWPDVLERGLRGYEQDRRDREKPKKRKLDMDLETSTLSRIWTSKKEGEK
jgi:hypothetical protein